MTEHEARVLPEWIDANGHMNLAYYVVVFDHATDVLFDAIGVGEAYRADGRATIFVAETHTLYEREVAVGDALRVGSRLFAADRKRLHFGHEMFHVAGGFRAATQELIALHVDMASRRTADFPPALAARLADAAGGGGPVPDWVGRQIAMPGGR
ncbi:thioesterase family protein [Acidisphaera rubrifaciens]|uniref:3-hydroxyacyl-CoA dehydrogenase n=1 Tax=Acidisphaera rubrifaciens HS-AP3 TaxID=1231350 RepID=A0A0D6P7P8_9PROT|nr:thioesterase family protein [Acidisphaera rubrifaciens]GAN77790.1 3-hydroxyacyl-CoA dehydrogenase [Acidisphaera rubrifaciens HS-AP3]